MSEVSQQLIDHMDHRLDKIEAKLDSHLERVTRNEEGLESVRGHIKLIMSVLLAVVSAAITGIIRSITGGLGK